MSTVPLAIRWLPSLSVEGIAGAVFEPASMQGEEGCRWKSKSLMNLGAVEMSCPL